MERRAYMKYAVVIHKDRKSDFGVTVPDLPGCYSLGHSFEEALENSIEAIECHVEGLLKDGDPLPVAKSIEEHMKKYAYKNGVWAYVSVDLSRLSGKAKRINITIPEYVLSKIDIFATKIGESRSALLTQAVLTYLGKKGTIKKYLTNASIRS